MTDLSQKTAQQVAQLLQNQEITPCDIMANYKKCINSLNPQLNAFAFLDLNTAEQAAKKATNRWKMGKNLSAYDGIGFTAKDLMPAKDMPYRQGSALCDDTLCQEDAPAIARMKEMGMILIGKTTSCEFGHKGVTNSLIHGTSKNPHNPHKTCGGSSGGAAIAAACQFGHFHLGNDGGGSIRIPASFCGLYGFKPSPDLVPVYPAGWMSDMRLSTTGMISRHVDDLITGMHIIAQPDIRTTSTSHKLHNVNLGCGGDAFNKLKIGFTNNIPKLDAAAFIEMDIINHVTSTAERIFASCNTFDTADFYPNVTDVFNIFWQQIAHFVVDALTPEEQALMDPHFIFWADKGKYNQSSDITRAQHARIDIKERMHKFFENYDFLVCPTMVIPPFDIGQNAPLSSVGDVWHDWSPYTYLANLAELPAVTIPIGFDKCGLPIGLQIIAANGCDHALLQCAKHIADQFPVIETVTKI